jgi:dipeptidyl aminopeptidase/acylaminoacyl peptidase
VFRPLALVALLLLLTAACGSGGAEEDRSGNGGEAAPEGLSLVVYKETLSNVVYAEQLPKQRYWQFMAESDTDFLQAMSCTPDGKHAAYLMQTTDGATRLKISGRADPIPIAGQSTGLTWAPDGSKIAVTTFDPGSSANQLQLFDVESGQASIVASGRGSIGPPRWSPDGSRIVFDASDGQVNQIFVHTVGGPGASKLAERSGNAFAPDWSPDGAKLVFAALGPGEIHQLYTMNPDGSDEKQITDTKLTKAFPRWAPDGSLIAFAGTVLVPTAAERPALVHNLAVFAVKPDGTGEEAITDVVSDSRLGGWCVSGPWLNDDWQVAS